MSREHAPAVKELAERLASNLIRNGIVPAIDRPVTIVLAANSIAEGLAPLLDKSRTVCHWVGDDSDICHNAHESFDSELARWEPPNPEAK